MSDLAATNCGGCGNGCGCQDNGCNSIIWLILILLLCNNCGSGCNNGCMGGDSCLWVLILLIFFCCGNGFGGCGCGF